MIRLASRAAVMALCAAGTPAIAHGVGDAEPDWHVAVTKTVALYVEARDKAEHFAMAHPSFDALLQVKEVEDIINPEAMAVGDDLFLGAPNDVLEGRTYNLLAGIARFVGILTGLGRPGPEEGS